jgi:hypothetical protein
MIHLADLAVSAVVAALAWGIYRWTDHPGSALGFLALATAGFIWYRWRADADE